MSRSLMAIAIFERTAHKDLQWQYAFRMKAQGDKIIDKDSLLTSFSYSPQLAWTFDNKLCQLAAVMQPCMTVYMLLLSSTLHVYRAKPRLK